MTQTAMMDETVSRLRAMLVDARRKLDETWQWPAWTGVHDNTDIARANLLKDETRIEYLHTADRAMVVTGNMAFEKWQEKAYWVGDDITKQVGYALDNNVISGLKYVAAETRDEVVAGVNQGVGDVLAYVQKTMPWLIPLAVGIVLVMIILAVAF